MDVPQLKHQSTPPVVTVIGAGVIGALTALQFVRAGFQVTVLDASKPGHGASGNAIPWTNASGKSDKRYFDLCNRSLGLWRTLADELGTSEWLRVTGNLHWVSEASARRTLDDAVARAQGRGYDVRCLTPEQVAELEPGLNLSNAIGEAALYPAEGVVHPRGMLAAVQAYTTARGARWIAGCRVAKLVREGDRVTELITADGDHLETGRVVLCTGLATNVLLQGLGAHLSMIWYDQLGTVTNPDRTMYRTIHGVLVDLPSNPTGIQRIIHAPGVTILPSEDGGLILHSLDLNGAVALTDRLDPPPEVASQIHARAVAAVPALAGVEVQGVRLGRRPIPVDGRPALGTVPGMTNCHLIVSHSAFSTAPALAEDLLAHVVRSEPIKAAFDAARLLTAAA